MHALDFPNLVDGPSPGPLADLLRTALLPCLRRRPGGVSPPEDGAPQGKHDLDPAFRTPRLIVK
jgi:hypothetical protein